MGLILGGSEKNADFSLLAKKIAVSLNIRAIALLGETSNRIHQELEKCKASESIIIQHCKDLKESLEFLLKAVPKGIILLSPACASFGLFANYKERGEKFKQLVQKITGS